MISWYDRRPNDVAQPNVEDPREMLIDPDLSPDWVRLPTDLEGAHARVRERRVAPCVCSCSHDVVHLDLDNGVSVAECSNNGVFLWYTT